MFIATTRKATTYTISITRNGVEVFNAETYSRRSGIDIITEHMEHLTDADYVLSVLADGIVDYREFLFN